MIGRASSSLYWRRSVDKFDLDNILQQLEKCLVIGICRYVGATVYCDRILLIETFHLIWADCGKNEVFNDLTNITVGCKVEIPRIIEAAHLCCCLRCVAHSLSCLCLCLSVSVFVSVCVRVCCPAGIQTLAWCVVSKAPHAYNFRYSTS